MKQDTSWTPLIVLVIILAMVWGSFELGVLATIDSCNTKDEFGQFIHRDSWVCDTRHGERVK
mgnify:CR=1 FL=1